jgi:hypothetical protein
MTLVVFNQISEDGGNEVDVKEQVISFIGVEYII